MGARDDTAPLALAAAVFAAFQLARAVEAAPASTLLAIAAAAVAFELWRRRRRSAGP
jgi:hypothetical protein